MGSFPSKFKKNIRKIRHPSQSLSISTNHSSGSNDNNSISSNSNKMNNGSQYSLTSVSSGICNDGFRHSHDIDNFNLQEIISHRSILNQTVDRKHQEHFLYKHFWGGCFSSPIGQKLKNGCKVADIK